MGKFMVVNLYGYRGNEVKKIRCFIYIEVPFPGVPSSLRNLRIFHIALVLRSGSGREEHKVHLSRRKKYSRRE